MSYSPSEFIPTKPLCLALERRAARVAKEKQLEDDKKQWWTFFFELEWRDNKWNNNRRHTFQGTEKQAKKRRSQLIRRFDISRYASGEYSIGMQKGCKHDWIPYFDDEPKGKQQCEHCDATKRPEEFKDWVLDNYARSYAERKFRGGRRNDESKPVFLD
jgi:hypothetical protein